MISQKTKIYQKKENIECLFKKINKDYEKNIQPKFLDFYDFMSNSSRTNERITIPLKDLNNEKIIKDNFQKFLKNEKLVVIESTELPTKSKSDMVKNINHMLNQFPNAYFLFTGDQPVYEEQRNQVSKLDRVFGSFFGKFHLKQVMLRGINQRYYDNLIGPTKDKFTPKKKKSLKMIPQGYFKLSEQLFVNVFFYLWKLFVNFYRYVSNIRTKKKLCHISFNQFKFIYANSYVNGYKIKELDEFCCNIGLSYFLLLKSIKTNNFDIYILVLKMFLRWSLSTGIKSVKKNDSQTETTKNISHYNYFRIVCLHLYDIKYLYNNALLLFIKQNFTYNFNSNPISFDQMTEIRNLDIKKGAKGATPINHLKKMSSMNSLIRFVTKINKKQINYTKKMEMENFQISKYLLNFGKSNLSSTYNSPLNSIENIKKKCFSIINKRVIYF